jgi:hypothetical protein
LKSLRERLRQLEPSPRWSFELRRPATESLLAAEPTFEAIGGGALRRVLLLPDLPPPDALDAAAWRLFACAERRPPLPWIVFDCETTGLESGAGSFIFLLGWVEWRATGSRCIQFFLPEPSAEPGMLDAFEAALEEAGALLSYNGKSFDLPRVRSRLALQRRTFSGETLPHMDLLHPCRRITRNWLGDSRLGTMEREFLGRERERDLSGAEVPEVYRRFLRGDADAPILRVLEHNRRDVIHLSELAAVLASRVNSEHGLPATARLEVARLYEARGELAGARARYAALAAERGEVGRRALFYSGQLLKRARDFGAAQACFEELLRRQPDSVQARVELAKLLEHRLRDAAAARRLTLEALGALDAAELVSPRPTARRRSERKALRHRLQRLERKCGSRR